MIDRLRIRLLFHLFQRVSLRRILGIEIVQDVATEAGRAPQRGLGLILP